MRHLRNSQEESYSYQCSTTSLVDQETTKKNACQMPISSLYMQRDLEKDNGQFIGPGSAKKRYCIREDSPQGVWDNVAERMLLEFAKKRLSNLPRYEPIVQRSTQKQWTWKTVDTLCSRPGLY